MGIHIRILVWFSQNLMVNSHTVKFMFSKINKTRIGIHIAIPPIQVEMKMLIFVPKLEYCIFLFYSYFNFNLVHPNRKFKILRNYICLFHSYSHCQTDLSLHLKPLI